MRGTALLFAYPEQRFIDPVTKLYEYLLSVDFTTHFHVMGSRAKGTQRRIEIGLSEADQHLPFLLLYWGHGAPQGWGHYPSNEILSYRWLSSRLAQKGLTQGTIVNSCCYAKYLFAALGKHPEMSVSAMAPWDGAGLSYGGNLMERIIHSWPQAECADEFHKAVCEIKNNGNSVTEHPYVQRYGQVRDYLFFPEGITTSRRSRPIEVESVQLMPW